MGYINDVDELIEEQKKVIEVGKMMEKLQKNREFKKLFLEYFTRDRISDLVRMKTDHERQNPADQLWIDTELNAISYVMRFITDRIDLGERATQALKNTQFEKEQYLSDPDNEEDF